MLERANYYMDFLKTGHDDTKGGAWEMENNCIFCKIAAKEIPSNVVYEDDKMIVFHDISPAAPVHVLAIPKKHIDSVLALTAEDESLMGHMMRVMANVAADLGVDEKGFRIVTNTKEDGGQTVNHLHFHLIGGRSMEWPPG